VLGTFVKWGRLRVGESGAPKSVAGVIGTVADKTPFPRRTRNQTKKALKHAARELHRQTSSPTRKKKEWLFGGLLVTATVVGTIVLARALSERFYPEVLEVVESIPAHGEEPVETPARK
jgi:hypothetical protein